MKTIKHTQKLVAIFLTFVLLMPTFVSCTKDNEEKFEINNYEYREKAKDIINGIDLINNNQNSFRTIGDIELTQEIVDEYALLLGYQEGEFTVEMIDTVIDKYNVAKVEGMEQFLDEYNFNEFTKITLKDISEGNWIQNLENQPNYANLNLNEKELLSLTNAYAQELNAQGRPFWGLFGAVVGAIIGSLICGICALGGAIVGGLIGGGK